MQSKYIPILVVLIIGLIYLALVIGLALGIGWLLTRFLSFSLFEAALFTLVGLGMAGMAAARTGDRLTALLEDEDLFEFEDAIPPDRLIEIAGGKTIGAWFMTSAANNLYLELTENDLADSMKNQDIQELSIRLTEIGTAALKARTPRSKNLRLTVSNLQKQMQNMDMKPYDTDLLAITAGVINAGLILPNVEDIVRKRLWDEPAVFPYQLD